MDLVLAVQPARARRCHPHAPPFPCSSGSAFHTYPDGASHASQSCLVSKRFSLISGTASCRCSDGVSHTRRDVASSASVTVHSIASIVELGLGGGPTLALLRTLSQAEFTSPSPSWRLMEDRSCSSSFPTQHRSCFLHCLPFSVS